MNESNHRKSGPGSTVTDPKTGRPGSPLRRVVCCAGVCGSSRFCPIIIVSRNSCEDSGQLETALEQSKF